MASIAFERVAARARYERELLAFDGALGHLAVRLLAANRHLEAADFGGRSR